MTSQQGNGTASQTLVLSGTLAGRSEGCKAEMETWCEPRQALTVTRKSLSLPVTMGAGTGVGI